MMGSGSLANDAVAAQLSLERVPGMILANGEFGRRLCDQGTRIGLEFELLERGWGEPILRGDVEKVLDRRPGLEWLWAVHHETSTGVLNDLGMLTAIGRERGLKVCVDAISSIGLVDVDLSRVYLASGVSGKGLGSYPGLSMVYYDHDIVSAPRALPRSLDLGYYAQHDGIPFTISSNLVYALKAAVERIDPVRRTAELAEIGERIREKQRGMGIQILAPDEHACPPVITIVLPPGESSEEVGRGLEEEGYLLSYRSEYLLKRNWIQICLMGEGTREQVAPLLDLLGKISSSRKRVASGGVPSPEMARSGS